MSAPAHHDSEGPDRLGRLRLVGRLFRRGPSPEERIGSVIDAHRQELDDQLARFEQTIDDLERREQLLSDSRASIERLLRLGSKDLDAREADIARLIAELTAREERLRDEEIEIANRRAEIGAVELRRARVEQHERALQEREARLAARERDAAAAERARAPRLAFVPGQAYRLLELDEDAVEDGAVTVDGERYEIARVGPSPLPRDERRCAYLVRGPWDLPPVGGSS